MTAIIRGSTGIIRQVFLKDSTQTDGRGKTGLPVFTFTDAGDTGNYLASWVLTGFNDLNSNTESGLHVWYWNLTKSGTTYTVDLYLDTWKSILVASGSRTGIGSITLTAINSSGLSGSVVLSGSPATDNDVANTLTANPSISVSYKRNYAPWAESTVLVDSSIVILGKYAGDYASVALKEIDATNMPGLYELHLPNNSVAEIPVMGHLVDPKISTLAFSVDPNAWKANYRTETIGIATCTWLSNVVTVTTTTPHNLQSSPERIVTIYGTSVPGYDGIYTATITGVNTFTYPNMTPLGASVGGMMDYERPDWPLSSDPADVRPIDYVDTPVINADPVYELSDELVVMIKGTGIQTAVYTFGLVGAGDNNSEGIIINALPNVKPDMLGGLITSTGII